MELTLFTLQLDKASLSRNVLGGVPCVVCEAGDNVCSLAGSSTLRISINGWTVLAQRHLKSGVKGSVLDTTSDVTQAPFSALRIVSTGCCEPGDPT